MKIGIFPIGFGGCAYYRLYQPMRKLEKCFDIQVEALVTKYLNTIENDSTTGIDEFTRLRTFSENKDILVVQRRYGESWEYMIQEWKGQNKIVIYELDDTYTGIPLENLALNAKHMTKPQTISSVIRILNLVDIITVSTPELRAWVIQYCDFKKVYVLKNTIDFSLWPKPHFGEKNDVQAPIIVGWAGAASHKTDLKELEAPYTTISLCYNKTKQLNKELTYTTQVLFGFVGYMTEYFWHLHPHVGFQPGVHFLDYPQILAERRFDIATAPLKQCFFNECKSELRYLEHAALGVPVIATDIAPYKRTITNNVNGLLVNNRSRHWVRAIKQLIEDEPKRKELGKKAYEHVMSDYNLDTYITHWYKLYNSLGV